MNWTRRDVLFAAGALVGVGAGAALRAALGAPATPLLRPPGAANEAEFLAACTRCGQCIEACPFDTLHLADAAIGPNVATPTFDPRETPCHICQGYDELLCIGVCPTNALQSVADNRAIRIGVAEILQDLCLAFNGVVCRACWHACPFANEAIRFDERLRPVVVEDACIGCGLCTHACPTETTSIPIRAHEL